MRRGALLFALSLLLASAVVGCTRPGEDCRAFPDTPRIIHQHPGRAELEDVAALLRERGWTLHEEQVARPERDRVYALMEGAGPRLVLAYYDARPHGGERSSVEVYALNVTSDAEARTRELLAPAAPTLAALNATLGEPTEVRVEALARSCATAWVPEGCFPGPRETTRAPWETGPTMAAPSGAECRAVSA